MLILFGPALRGAGGAMDGSHCSGERVPFEAFGVLRKAQWHFDDASVQSVVRGWLGWPGHTRVASTPARARNLDLVRIDLEVAPPRLSRLIYQSAWFSSPDTKVQAQPEGISGALREAFETSRP